MMRLWFTVSIGLLVLGGLFFGMSAAAQIGGEQCCVKGPGLCYTKPNDGLANCNVSGYLIQSRACQDISTCQEPIAQEQNCCVCPPQAGYDGFCTVISERAPGCDQQVCNASPDYCTEISQCREWSTPSSTDPDPPRLVKFIPQVTIPGSDLFNKGQAVVITGATLGEYIAAIYIFFVGVAGILAIVFIMYGGVRYVVSMGSPEKVSQAKDTITSALMGLLIAIASYIILLTINPNLVAFNGLEVDSYFPVQQEEILEGTYKVGTYVWQGNVDEFDNCLTEEATANGLDRNRLKALMLVESAGDPNAQSSAGAYGLIQLLPTTADDYLPGVTAQQLLNPGVNIHIAAQYYRDLLQKTCPTSATYRSGKKVSCDPSATQCTDGDHKYANAGYNGGLGANCSSITCPGLTWWECEANEGYAETRAYVGKVQAAYEKILLSQQNPGNYPDFVWNDATPTCAELRGQPSSPTPPLPPPPPTCNNNGTCDPGEDNASCPADCFCGNGTCDSDEGYTSCPADCTTATPPAVTLYAGTGSNGDVYKSIDGGLNWTNTAPLPGAGNVESILEDGGTVYAGTNVGVFRTTDGGTTWNGPASLSGAISVVDLLAVSGTLYASTSPNGDVFRSDDGGVTWNNTADIPNMVIAYDLHYFGGEIYVGGSSSASQGQVYKSGDGGTTWTATASLPGSSIVDAMVAIGTTLYAGTSGSGHIYTSTNGGTTWTDTGPPAAGLVRVDDVVAIGASLFAASGNGGDVFRSTDGGATWTNTANLPGAVVVYDLKVFGSVLFAATSSSGDIFWSDDEGANWHPTSDIPGAFYVFDIGEQGS